MEFRVLGPLQVLVGGEPVRSGGIKQQTLLAMLLESVGAYVSVDSLLMGMYGLDADPRSRRTVQTYVSQIRGVLGDVVDYAGGAYRLEVPTESVDAVRFEALVEDAGRVIDPVVAVEMFRDALSMWEGPAYHGLEGADPLWVEARRLEELKCNAIEARIDLELALGNHRGLLAELESLTSEYPTRERMVAQRMLALYQDDRQSDALRLFSETERLLAEEFGVAPGDELGRLKQMIIDRDESLDRRSQNRIRRIPVRLSSFVGREEVLTRARELVGVHRLVTVIGPGGVGKSSLANEVARSLAGTYQSIFVPIEDQRDSQPGLSAARSFGLTPASGVDPIDLLVDWVGDRELLVVLDGCEHRIEQVGGLAERVLQECVNARFLITSREPIGLAGEQLLRVAPLPTGTYSDSNRLFLDRAGLAAEDLSADETAQVTAIGEAVSGLPLALEIAAGKAQLMHLKDIAAGLKDQPTFLRGRSATGRQSSIEASIEWSYNTLGFDLQQALNRLGVTGNTSIPRDAAWALVGGTNPLGVLSELAAVSLLVPARHEQESYSMLEPVRQYAEQKLIESGEFDQAMELYAAWVVDECKEVRQAEMNGHAARAVARLSILWPAAARVARWAAEHGHDDVTLEIIVNTGRTWNAVADPDELLKVASQVVPRFTEPLNSTQAIAKAVVAFLQTVRSNDTALGLLEELGSLDRASYDDLTRFALADLLGTAWGRTHSSRSLLSRSQLERSLALNDEAMEISHRLGYPPERFLHNRSLYLEYLGRHQESMEDMEALIAWAGESRPIYRARGLTYLARYRYLSGMTEEAGEMIAEAERLCLENGDVESLTLTVFTRACVALGQADPTAAKQAIKSIDLHRRMIGIAPVELLTPEMPAAVASMESDWGACARLLSIYFGRKSQAIEDDLAQALVFDSMSRLLVATGNQDSARSVASAGLQLIKSHPVSLSDDCGVIRRLKDLSGGYEDKATTHPQTWEQTWDSLRVIFQKEVRVAEFK